MYSPTSTITTILLVLASSLHLTSALPTNTTKPATSPSTTCLPTSSSNTTAFSVSLPTFNERASDFCAQLGGEGMYGSRIILFQAPAMEISFSRSNGMNPVEGEVCAKMDEEECLKGLAALVDACASASGEEPVLQGVSSHRTGCGTYGVKVSPEAALAVEGNVVGAPIQTGAAVGLSTAGSRMLFVSFMVWNIVFLW